MNRIIKFRAWDKKLNVMWEMWPTEEGYFMFHPDHRGTTTHDFYEEIGYIIMNEERFELMQFTGLIDKNGVDIYEGDIIKHKVLRLKDGVGWEDEDWEDVWEEEIIEDLPEFFEMKGYAEDELGQNYDADHLEVIGNIYQNPELLNPKNHD